MSAIAKLASRLTDDNHLSVLARASGRSKREILELVAELEPRLHVPPSLRKLPVRRAAAPPVAPAGSTALAEGTEVSPTSAHAFPEPPTRPATIEPLSPARYKVQFTASGGGLVSRPPP